MDRLTKRFGDKTVLPDIPLPHPATIKCSADLDKYHQNRRNIEAQIIRLAEYEDSGLSPEQVKELAKAKAEGRLVVLPVKVGDTLYYIGTQSYPEKAVFTTMVEEVALHGCKVYDGYVNYTDFGRTIFLTHEAAEKAIAEVGE